jgi:hypothetical protein
VPNFLRQIAIEKKTYKSPGIAQINRLDAVRRLTVRLDVHKIIIVLGIIKNWLSIGWSLLLNLFMKWIMKLM